MDAEQVRFKATVVFLPAESVHNSTFLQANCFGSSTNCSPTRPILASCLVSNMQHGPPFVRDADFIPSAEEVNGIPASDDRCRAALSSLVVTPTSLMAVCSIRHQCKESNADDGTRLVHGGDVRSKVIGVIMSKCRVSASSMLSTMLLRPALSAHMSVIDPAVMAARSGPVSVVSRQRLHRQSRVGWAGAQAGTIASTTWSTWTKHPFEVDNSAQIFPADLTVMLLSVDCGEHRYEGYLGSAFLLLGYSVFSNAVPHGDITDATSPAGQMHASLHAKKFRLGKLIDLRTFRMLRASTQSSGNQKRTQT
ncbi:hypothetical protein BKA93DRAFT_751329 [Sparassis latifolia]